MILEGDTPAIRQKGKLSLLLASGPAHAMWATALQMLQRAKRKGLQQVKPGLGGIEHWDHAISKEQWKAVAEEGRLLRRGPLAAWGPAAIRIQI